MFRNGLGFWTWTNNAEVAPFVATRGSMLMMHAGYIRRNQLGHRKQMLNIEGRKYAWELFFLGLSKMAKTIFQRLGLSYT